MFVVIFSIAQVMFLRLVCFSARAAFILIGMEASAELASVCVSCSILGKSGHQVCDILDHCVLRVETRNTEFYK